MPESTPEPWTWQPGHQKHAALVCGPTGLAIGVFTGLRCHEDAARAVLCVNALRGVSTQLLEEADTDQLASLLRAKAAFERTDHGDASATA